VVLDLYSRAIVGWAMDQRMTAQLVRDALTMALWRPAKASIFEYIEVFYNQQRKHSAINYQAPMTFEKHSACA